MTNDETWEQVEALLRKEKKSQTKGQAQQLRAYVGSLLATSEGRKSVQDRFNNNRPFQGKMRFLSEVVRVLGKPDLSNLPADERQSFLNSFLLHAKPTVDSVYWEILWLLQEAGYIQAGRTILESLNKVGNKKEELSKILVGLQAWQTLSKERALVFLESARRSAFSSDDIPRLEKAIIWAKSRLLSTQAEPFDKTRHETAETSPTKTAIAEIPKSVDVDPNRATETPATDNVQVEPIPPGQAAIKKKSSVKDPREVKVVELGGVSECLNEVNRIIDSAFRRQEDLLQATEASLVCAKADLIGIRDQLDRTLVDLQTTRGHLQHETEITEELRRERIHLEERLVEREHELGRLRGELQKHAQRLTDALQETEAARRRAEDYIHHADRDKGNAVVTFQTQLWDSLQYYLIEVLEDEPDLSSLNEDQRLFRRRLREIKDVLREKGIPPG